MRVLLITALIGGPDAFQAADQELILDPGMITVGNPSGPKARPAPRQENVTLVIKEPPQ